MNCPSCASDVEEKALSCPSCGASFDAPGLHPTRTFLAPATPGGSPRAPGGAAGTRSGSRALSSLSSDPSDHGRFVPGSLLLDRYRILGLLGRGGMGEVYRADDLVLGQQVALKFLPLQLAEDPERLGRFRGEVRLAREVSHPCVCRVYDIAEADGQIFLSMEYIDGEDLGSLLRRIGRLPRDKALEIARQLCAGLAAAHDRGVVHRDLKPANVMIDGRGRARITDFGLASIAGAAEGRSDRSGTPAYMAPEQLAGGAATVRSDLYALGLVLYELFTGKRPFHGDTIADVTRSRAETPPLSPSTVIEGLDPAIERVILRCLERDPSGRPASALKVAAALPGGDPLAMALAAGETPSPEMVASSGEAGTLTPAVVRFWILGLVAGAIAVSWALDHAELLRRIETPKSTEVLLDRARQIARISGYMDPPDGVAYGYGYHRTYLDHIQATDPSPGRWDRLARSQPPTLYLWYRQSPRPLQALSVDGTATDVDPPPILPGMLSLMITSSGDLWELNAVPPQVDDGEGPSAPADWAPLFHEAGLKIGDFTPVAPRWVPDSFGDARAAWEGSYADAPELRVRVEAASFRGRPITFRIYWPWNRPLRTEPFQATQSEEIAGGIILVLAVATLVGGALLARANVRLGRVDWRGAFRLGLVMFAASLLGSLFAATHVLAPGGEWDLLTRLFGRSLFDAFYVWVIYVALEPLVRRRWPERIVSWTRLLGGRLQDPMVGRDLLIGVGTAAGMAIMRPLLVVIPARLGWPTVMLPFNYDLIAGPAAWIAGAMSAFTFFVSFALILMSFLCVMRVVLRRTWAASTALFALVSTIVALAEAPTLGPLAIVVGILQGALFAWISTRFGLLAMTTAIFAVSLLFTFPVAAWPGAWYAAPGLFVFLLLAVIVAFGARAALAGRSLLEMRALHE